MAVELRVPEVGESITEVEIGDWLKAEGERVSREEAVVMIDTDKVTVELPAPVTGVITKILVAKGGTAKVGDVIGYMDEAPQGARAGRESSPPPPPAPAPVATAPTAAAAPAPTAAVAPPPAPPPPEPAAPARVMPAAARALHDTGLSAAQVPATGPGGRLLKEDVDRAAKAAPARAPAPPSHAPAGDREEEIVAMTPMRRRIAERLVEAQQTAAMLTTFNECDMSAVMKLRKQLQDEILKAYHASRPQTLPLFA